MHAELGYPAEVTTQTIQQIVAYESNHLRGRGTAGIYENQFQWLCSYLKCPLVRLGRLEYQLHGYGGGVTAWRRKSDGAVLGFAEDGAQVDADGLLTKSASWCATLRETETTITGHPVAPTGHVLRQPLTLSRKLWQPLLRKGDTVLDLHIPAGGGMTWEAVCDSFRQAANFFPKYHPNQPFAAVTVATWFLDPRLNELLPPTANPLRFQRACYLFPTPPRPGGLWFVFFKNPATCDLAELPRDTTLRRALADFLSAGYQWHGGGMFILPEDLANPREGIYLERFNALTQEFGQPHTPII